ncbi:LysR family transcriptional regulator [Nocardioides sp. NPDC051685]|uniref:LysR family transcriptional regulator n=1 Tax=Nocardioides sp. NPDC051685 TaxID=3364334 RepID=UPI0037A52AE8
MLDLHKLYQFHTLASIGSYAKAAGVLNVTQPSLTRAVQALERQYDVRLIDRSRGRSGIQLTDAGLELYARAGQLLNESDAIERRLRDDATSAEVLAFGCGPVLSTMLLHQISAQFAEGPPDRRVRVLVAPAPALLDSLLDGTIEFYLGHVPLGERSTSRLRQRFFARWPRIGLWVARDHPLLSQPRIRFKDLTGFPRLSTTTWANEMAMVADDDTRAMLDSTICIDDHPALVNLALNTDGILISVLDNSAAGLVELPVPLDADLIAVAINVVSIRGIPLSPRATQVLEELRRTYGSAASAAAIERSAKDSAD